MLSTCAEATDVIVHVVVRRRLDLSGTGRVHRKVHRYRDCVSAKTRHSLPRGREVREIEPRGIAHVAGRQRRHRPSPWAGTRRLRRRAAPRAAAVRCARSSVRPWARTLAARRERTRTGSVSAEQRHSWPFPSTGSLRRDRSRIDSAIGCRATKVLRPSNVKPSQCRIELSTNMVCRGLLQRTVARALREA